MFMLNKTPSNMTLNATTLQIMILMHQIEEVNKQTVWEKAREVYGFDPNIWRKDKFGYWIQYSDYANRQSEYGWEKHHIFPKSLGGSDKLYNIEPLHWRNNLTLGARIIQTLANRAGNRTPIPPPTPYT